METLIGRFAVSKAGHDVGAVYLIIGQEGERLLLCDGRYKPLAKPKKKSGKHVQISAVTAEEPLLSGLLKKERIFDHQIKYAIKKYITNQ